MLDSNALAALSAIGSSLPPGGDEKTFAEVQADSDREERTLQALSDRLKKAMGSYQHIMWLLDGAPEGKHGVPEYIDRLVMLGKFEASADPTAFVEEFEAKLQALNDELTEVEEAEGTLDDIGRRRYRR